MNRMTFAFAMLAALVIGTGSAYAVEVKKHIAAPGQPEKVWAIVSDFCSIKDWHPVVADCQETKEGDATFRTLTLKDGGKIKEKLLGSDDTSYSYEIIESPLPVKNYKAKLSVEADERGDDRSVITWEATFDANGKSDEEAAKTIGDIFFAGLKGIKQKALPPDGTAGGD
jgi:Polyketide cyclase / dehydrase and lipid transport